MSQNQLSKQRKTEPLRNSMESILEQWSRERPDLNLSAMAVIGELLQTGEMLRRGVQDLWAEAGLDFPALDVILTLRRQGKEQALSPSALAKEMMLSTSAMTNRLDRLEKRGIVQRVDDPNDRRAIQVLLTSKGFQLAEDMMESHVAKQQEMLHGLSEDERIQLRTLLLKIMPEG